MKKLNKGITLIALVVTVVVLLILAGVTITLMFGENSIFDLAKEAGDKTNKAIENETEGMEKVKGDINKWANGNGSSSGEDNVEDEVKEPSLKPSNNEENIEGVTFSTAYGKLDVIWLDGTTNTPSKTQTPNSPANYLNGMQPIKWNGTEETPATVADTDWYSYNEATGTTDSKKSHWANAKTTNGSYFVWIPRYAYRITYYDKDYNTDSTAQVTGYYDGYGMWKAETGELKCKLETGVETILNYNDKSYIVHPAFTTNLDMGGWSNNLPGFWFAKFEMSGDGSSTTSLKSTPNTSSYTGQTIGKFYTDARTATYGMTGTTDTADNNTSFMYSHMAKNSEWGAVAYLTHSQYGRNGYEIGFNTGNGTKSAAITATNQSTTGNAYGVYDMRGGSYECTAGFDKNSTSSYMTNGSPFTDEKASTKYATAYNGTTTNSKSPAVYNICKTGDGIKEAYVSGSVGWFSDYSIFAYSGNPFFKRGSSYSYGEASTGIFCSDYYYGGTSNEQRFPRCLVPINVI